MDSDLSRVRLVGPLEAYGSGFAMELARIGYRNNPVADQLRLMAHLSRWLSAQGLGPADITPAMCDAFLAARRSAGYTLWLSRKALVPMLHYLRDIGAVPGSATSTAKSEGGASRPISRIPHLEARAEAINRERIRQPRESVLAKAGVARRKPPA